MAVYKFSATIGPGESQRWWTGGGDFYDDNHFPQFDVRVIPVPGIFPEGSDTSPALIYKDFACAVNVVFPYRASYFLTVENNSDRTISYDMRIWLP